MAQKVFQNILKTKTCYDFLQKSEYCGSCKSIIFQEEKTLDLRYNELWTNWDDTDEFQDKMGDVHGQLFLSWRNINVSVKQITQKFFKPSEITYKNVLNNSKYLVKMYAHTTLYLRHTCRVHNIINMNILFYQFINNNINSFCK